ncbi:hypothetical protein ACNKHX_11605 [Shigella flexneri]
MLFHPFRAGAENWLKKCGFVDIRIVDV